MRWIPLLLFAAACTPSTETAQTELWQANFNRWNAVGPASYDMVLQEVCECAGGGLAVRVEVRNEVVTARINVDTSQPIAAALNPNFPDVPGLFALIKQALDQHYFSHTANYDGTDGHPVQVNLNKDGSRIDDDVYYSVRSFVPITP